MIGEMYLKEWLCGRENYQTHCEEGEEGELVAVVEGSVDIGKTHDVAKDVRNDGGGKAA